MSKWIKSNLEDVISDWISSINSCGSLTDDLPQNLRAFYLNNSSIISTYKNYIAINDEGEFIRRLTSTLGQDFRQVGLNGVQAPSFQARQIYADKKYPSPENLKVLFNRLGISDVFSYLNRSARADMRAIIVSFNDTRTSVAHQGIPVGVNYKDIIVKLKDIDRVVGHLDRVLYAHVTRHTGLVCWRTI